jgi:hypothetical protein
MVKSFAVVLVVLSSGCASSGLAERHRPATAATAALRRGDLAGAGASAETLLRDDPTNSRAAAVRALARYERSMHQLALDLRTLAVGGALVGGLNQRYLRSALTDGETALGEVDRDLEIAARDDSFSLDLCLACWERDWNGSGRVDERDRLLFQIEQDTEGNPIPDGDPRRKPTFRFDQGDVYWARAFVAFERAAIDLALAYDFSDLDRFTRDGAEARTIRLRLRDPERVRAARTRILEGLGFSRAAREAYLAETDDEREWMPNPRQKDHPLPLPVDAALYDTWQGVVGDLERLVRSEEGLSVKELALLDPRRETHGAEGYLDLGRPLSKPRDIVIDLDALEKQERHGDIEGMMKNLFGSSYVRSMRPSPLIGRVRRMHSEVERGEESLERKLRYLFWIN